MSGCDNPKMSGGGKKGKKWIQEVVATMDKGAFTKQALRHHELPLDYAKDVLKHAKRHTLKTRRRAQFLENIRSSKKMLGKTPRSTRKTRSRK